MSLDPDVMAARLRSYATSIAADQGVTVERVLEVMREALADMLHHRNCTMCGTADLLASVAPQDVTNA